MTKKIKLLTFTSIIMLIWITFATNISEPNTSNINKEIKNSNLELNSYLFKYFTNIDKNLSQRKIWKKLKIFANTLNIVNNNIEKIEKSLQESISSKKTEKKQTLDLLKNIIQSKFDNEYNNLLKNATLEQKIWQMIMIWFDWTGINTTWINNFKVKENLTNWSLWGIILYGRNIVWKDQLKDFMESLHTLDTAIPPFFAVDQEWWKVQRLKELNWFKNFPSAQEIGSWYSLTWAYEVYKEMWNMIKQYGFNLNLAPVVDVNINPNSPAIWAKLRSYSNDPEIVTKYATQAINAYDDIWILSALKHFPWHWSATNDSHLGFTDITKTWKKEELIPYIELIKNKKAKIIMTAHVFNALVDSWNTATLSDIFINKILRQKLWFTWVVITDDLDMWAIANMYKQDDAIIKAINAWNDILIISNYFNPDPNITIKIKNIIIKAIKDWKITESRINQSFERIMQLKKGLYFSN